MWWARTTSLSAEQTALPFELTVPCWNGGRHQALPCRGSRVRDGQAGGQAQADEHAKLPRSSSSLGALEPAAREGHGRAPAGCLSKQGVSEVLGSAAVGPDGAAVDDARAQALVAGEAVLGHQLGCGVAGLASQRGARNSQEVQGDGLHLPSRASLDLQVPGALQEGAHASDELAAGAAAF